MKDRIIKKRSDTIVSACDASLMTKCPSFVIGRINGSLEFWTCNQSSNQDSSRMLFDDVDALQCQAVWYNQITLEEDNIGMNGNSNVHKEVTVDGIIGICVVCGTDNDGREKNKNEHNAFITIHVVVLTEDGKIILFQLLQRASNGVDCVRSIERPHGSSWKWSQTAYISSEILKHDTPRWIFAGPPTRIKLKPDPVDDCNEDAILVPLQNGSLLLVELLKFVDHSQPNERDTCNNHDRNQYFRTSTLVHNKKIYNNPTKNTTFNSSPYQLKKSETLYGTFDKEGHPLICIKLLLESEDKNYKSNLDKCMISCCSLKPVNVQESDSSKDPSQCYSYALVKGPWCLENISVQTRVISSHDPERRKLLQTKLQDISGVFGDTNVDLNLLLGIQWMEQNLGVLCITPESVHFFSHRNGILASKNFFPDLSSQRKKKGEMGTFDSDAWKINCLCVIPPALSELENNDFYPYESTAVLVGIEDQRNGQPRCCHLFRIALVWHDFHSKYTVTVKAKDAMKKSVPHSDNFIKHEICSIQIVRFASHNFIECEEDSKIGKEAAVQRSPFSSQSYSKNLLEDLRSGLVCATSEGFLLSGAFIHQIPFLHHTNDTDELPTLEFNRRKKISNFPAMFAPPIKGAVFIPSFTPSFEREQNMSLQKFSFFDGQLAVISGANETSKLSVLNEGYFRPCATLLPKMISIDEESSVDNVDIGLGNSSFYRSPLICLAPTPPMSRETLKHSTKLCCLFFFSNNRDKTLVMKCSQNLENKGDRNNDANQTSLTSSSHFQLEPINNVHHTLGINDSSPTLAVCTVIACSSTLSRKKTKPKYNRLLMHANRIDIRCCKVAVCLSTDFQRSECKKSIDSENKAECIALYIPPKNTCILHVVFSHNDATKCSFSGPDEKFSIESNPFYCLVSLSDNSLCLLQLNWDDYENRNGDYIFSFQNVFRDLVPSSPQAFDFEQSLSRLCFNMEVSAISLFLKEQTPSDDEKEKRKSKHNVIFALAFYDTATILIYGMSHEKAQTTVVIKLLQVFSTKEMKLTKGETQIQSLQFLPNEVHTFNKTQMSQLRLVIGFSNGKISVTPEIPMEKGEFENIGTHDNFESYSTTHRFPTPITTYSYQLGHTTPRLCRLFISSKNNMNDILEAWLDKISFSETKLQLGNRDGFYVVMASCAEGTQCQPLAVLIGFHSDSESSCTNQNRCVRSDLENTHSIFIPIAFDSCKESYSTPMPSGTCEESASCRIYEELNVSYLSVIPSLVARQNYHDCCWMAFSGKRLNFASLYPQFPCLNATTYSLSTNANDSLNGYTPTHIHLMTLSSPVIINNQVFEFLILVALEKSTGTKLALYNTTNDRSYKLHPDCPHSSIHHWQPIWISKNIPPNYVITCMSHCPGNPSGSMNFKDLDCEIGSLFHLSNSEITDQSRRGPCVALSIIDYVDVDSRQFHTKKFLSTPKDCIHSSITVMELGFSQKKSSKIESVQLNPIANIKIKGACFCLDGLQESHLCGKREEGILFSAIDNKIIVFEWKETMYQRQESKISGEINKCTESIGNMCPVDQQETPFETSVTALACSWGPKHDGETRVMFVCAMQLLHSIAIFSYDSKGQKMVLIGVDLEQSRLSLSISIFFNNDFVVKEKEKIGSIEVTCVNQVESEIVLLSMELDTRFILPGEEMVTNKVVTLKRKPNPFPGESVIQLLKFDTFSSDLLAIGSGGSIGVL